MKIVNFMDSYSFYGDRENTIYLLSKEDLVHFSSEQGKKLCKAFEGQDWISSRDVIMEVSLEINKDVEAVAYNCKFDAMLFRAVGFAFNKIEILAPNTVQTEGILNKIERYTTLKNSAGEDVGIIENIVSIKTVPADDFYSKENKVKVFLNELIDYDRKHSKSGCVTSEISDWL